MSNVPAVSVVVPLFNAARYVAECLESLLAQTFADFEVIVVDDCSTDNSREIVERYLAKFGGRLKLSRTGKNSGSGAIPRNKGLQLSRGEYVFFVDADDLITPTALAELYTLANDYAADVVYCERYYLLPVNSDKVYVMSNQKIPLTDEPRFESQNLAERIQFPLDAKFEATPWCKFVRRELLIEHEIFFPHVKISEDFIWTCGLIFHAERFLRVPNATYVHRHAEGSMMITKRPPPEIINFWINPVLFGLKALNTFMDAHDFFRRNPEYRCEILVKFICREFDCIFDESLNLPQSKVYEALQDGFGEALGEQADLICALCTVINAQQKIFESNRQQFNRFAAQAQNRIAELEAQLK